jgi:hypothetical protein
MLFQLHTEFIQVLIIQQRVKLSFIILVLLFVIQKGNDLKVNIKDIELIGPEHEK